MSVSKWAYSPERCDGDYCPGDCDGCRKAEDLIRRSDAVALCDFYKGDDDAAAKIKYELLHSERTIPAVDAVEVVRCRECEKWRPGFIAENDDFVSPYCTVFNTPMLSNDYCAYPTPKAKDGQRRERSARPADAGPSRGMDGDGDG